MPRLFFLRILIDASLMPSSSKSLSHNIAWLPASPPLRIYRALASSTRYLLPAHSQPRRWLLPSWRLQLLILSHWRTTLEGYCYIWCIYYLAHSFRGFFTFSQLVFLRFSQLHANICTFSVIWYFIMTIFIIFSHLRAFKIDFASSTSAIFKMLLAAYMPLKCLFWWFYRYILYFFCMPHIFDYLWN